MKTKGLGFLGMFLAAVTSAACASLAGADLGTAAGAGGDFGGTGGEPPPSWSLHDTSGGLSNTGGSASKAPNPGCSWNEPTEVHLALPGFRSMASAPLARALTTADKLPDPERVRPRDFLNYYRVQYPSPQVDTDIGFYSGIELGELDTQIVLQIAVQAPAKYERPPIALAVVVDTSLSMAGEPWKRAKAAVAALASALQPGDSFTLVTTKRAQSSASDAAAAAALADGLVLDAGEDLAGALDDAYQAVSEAQASGNVGRVGRVVLITDGAAQATSIELDTVVLEAHQGVPLLGVGVGEAESYEGSLLEAATANGAGANVYLDGADEANAVLRARFDELMVTVASDIEVVVTLPESLHFLKSTDAGQADSATGIVTATLNAGRTLVFRNVLETCDPDLSLAFSRTITINVRHRPAGSPEILDSPPLGGLIADLKHLTQPQMLKAGAITAYAEGLANTRAPLLKHAADLSQAARSSDPAFAQDPDLLEIEALIDADLALINAAAPAP